MKRTRSQNEPRMTVVRYLYNRDMAIYTMFKIKPDGSGVYVLNGIEYTIEEFKKMYPIPLTLTSFNGVCADGRREWLFN
jgi:hypothetical protein